MSQDMPGEVMMNESQHHHQYCVLMVTTQILAGLASNPSIRVSELPAMIDNITRMAAVVVLKSNLATAQSLGLVPSKQEETKQ